MTTNTLQGYTFVITGTLSVPRAEFTDLLCAAGATISTTVNAKTNALVVGDDPGSKVELAESLGVPRITESAARAMVEGRYGLAQQVGLYTQKVYGSSDDLVELTGCVDEEYDGLGEATYLRFTNGTYIQLRYNEEGVWRIKVLDKGDGSVKLLYGLSDDDGSADGGGQRHGDDDAPSYSDVLILTTERPIEVESWGHEPLKKASPGIAVAKRVIKAMDSFGGFDHWWGDIAQDDKAVILEAIARAVEGGS